jgi:rhodanese-related sulfurtransferase
LIFNPAYYHAGFFIYKITMKNSKLSQIFWWLPIGKVPEILPSELIEKLNNPDLSPQLLDVRTHMEWHNGHLPGAINIPITELHSKIETLTLKKDQPVIAICLSAHRSIPAVRLLRRYNFQNVVQLAGGMIAWRRYNFLETK